MQLTREGYLRLYYNMGLAVIPVNSERVPLVKWREDFIDKGLRPTWEQIEDWFVKSKNWSPNIAVVCGKLSGDVIGLDFETEKGYLDFFTPDGAKKLEEQTIVENSPHGGVHVWLRELGQVPRRNVRICVNPPLDLLGEGGIMTVAPSVTNHLYCGKDKEHCPHAGVTPYTMRGASLEIRADSNIIESLEKRAKQLGWTLRTYDPNEIRSAMTEGVKIGNRNDRMFKLGRALIYDLNLDDEIAWYLMKSVNNQFRPPLAERDLRIIFEQASKYLTAQAQNYRRQLESGNGIVEI